MCAYFVYMCACACLDMCLFCVYVLENVRVCVCACLDTCLCVCMPGYVLVCVWCSRTPLATFHEGKHNIACMDMDPSRGLMVTCGSDRIVKVQHPRSDPPLDPLHIVDKNH